jgi:hypothetical protein
MMFNMIIPGVKNRRNGMTLETDVDNNNNKLKRRMPTAISAAKALITILYLLCLLLKYTTFVNLPQSVCTNKNNKYKSNIHRSKNTTKNINYTL